MLDLQLIQAYVDAALLEMHIRNTGKKRVKAVFRKLKPGVAIVPVHADASDDPSDFAERLAGLCHRSGWSAELDGPEKYVIVTSD